MASMSMRPDAMTCPWLWISTWSVRESVHQLGMGSGLGDWVWGLVERERVWGLAMEERLFISVVLDLGRVGRTGEYSSGQLWEEAG